MTVHAERDDTILVATIDRPQVANAIDRPTADALADVFRGFHADDGMHVAILTGANNTFCAGADLKAMRDPALDAARDLAREIAALPPSAVRSDRLSCYEQWSLAIGDALANEYHHGMSTLSTAEMFGGLDRYESGRWRHGDLS